VHDPSQGLVQEPDLLHDVQAAHAVQLDGRELLPVSGAHLPARWWASRACPHRAASRVWRIASIRLARMPISRPIMTAPRETRSL
jgi:hypothetical protein